MAMTPASDLSAAFKQQVEIACPKMGELLHYCYVSTSIARDQEKVSLLLLIYCPSVLFAAIKAQQDILKPIAQKLSGAEIVCLNARSFLRNTSLNLRETHPQLWLILRWIEETIIDKEIDRSPESIAQLQKLSRCRSVARQRDCTSTACQSLEL